MYPLLLEPEVNHSPIASLHFFIPLRIRMAFDLASMLDMEGSGTISSFKKQKI